MPPRDPDAVQLDFPELTADVIRQLRLIGQVGLLNFVPTMQPVYIAAQREGVLATEVNQPVFTSSEIFGSIITNAPVNTVFADTGPLTAGTYDVKVMISANAFGVPVTSADITFQLRDAPNTSSQFQVPTPINDQGFSNLAWEWTLATVVGDQERFRFQLLFDVFAGRLSTTIMARPRVIP